MELITSLQNAKIKFAVKLNEKSKERSHNNMFTIEGRREIDKAIACGCKAITLFVYPKVEKSLCNNLYSKFESIYEVDAKVFEKLAYRENSDGIVAIMGQKTHSLQDLKLSANPLIIVLEAVEKPGNLGAILRTADAASVDALIVCDPLCDLYNPNVIRSGLGCLFSVQTAVATSQEVLDFLKSKNINIFATELTAAQWYHQTDYKQPCAIVAGTEAYGLSDFWIHNANARIKIPMLGKTDSLNVSVSTAVVTFEAMRQRNFNNA